MNQGRLSSDNLFFESRLLSDSVEVGVENAFQKVFITGGAGFIGANLVKYLLDRGGFDITVYDDLSSGSRTNLNRAINDSKQKGNVELIEGNILDSDRLNTAVKDHKTVIHLAANTNVVESLKSPEKNFSVNVTGTFNVFVAARKNEVKRVVFASSNAAVGEQKPPINEKVLPEPISPYGAGKLCGEALCSAYYHSYGLEAVRLRFSNAYGPYSTHKTSVVVKFIKRVKQGKALDIYGDGNQTRDFVHAFDICQAIYLVTSRDPAKLNAARTPASMTFQIASGEETRIKDLAKMVSGLGVSTHHTASGIRYSNPRKGEIRRNFSDIARARQSLNYNPAIRLKQGLAMTWEWFNGRKR